MTKQVTAAAGASAESQQEDTDLGAGDDDATDASRSVIVTGGDAPIGLQSERIRQSVIRKWCQTDAIPENIRDQWIHGGINLDDVGDQIIQIKAERQKNARPVTEIGLSGRETQAFSIRKAIYACGSGTWQGAGLEANASAAVAQKLGRVHENNRFFIPMEVQQRAIPNPVEALTYGLMRQFQQAAGISFRDLTVASAASAGFLVGTSNQGFVELLRNLTVLNRMGVIVLPGLQQNITIPKQTGTAGGTWLTNEGTSIAEINQTFTQIALSPKNIGGYTEISRQLLLQSNPSAETLVMADLAAVVGIAIDLAGLNGSGAGGQPTGILQTAGIGSFTGTSIAYDDIIECQTDTAAGNALFQASGYVTTPPVAGLLKQRVKFASTASPIWEGQLLEGQVDGYRSMASNQMPTATALFGNFATVIQAEWGVLEVEVNPFANFPAGIVGVRAIASIDFGVRYPTAFSAGSSIT